MTPRQQRMLTVGLMLGGVTLATLIGVKARRSDLLFFVDPTELAAGEYPKERSFNLGGMVAEGSWVRESGSLESRFVVTDFNEDVTVRYRGVFPDLFREGQGVVVTGQLAVDGVFEATKVLAKHDENYMPPNVAESLEKRAKEQAKGVRP
ncbi:MAG: cytochrome c maturation protein CcmE [Pseudomonadota bacterium]